jgi:hypothetical protein
MQFNANIQPTHKHTHLQAAKSRHTNQGLQKSVLLANARQTTGKGAAGNKGNCCTTTLSPLQILKNGFIKSLLSVLVFELCFFE